MINFLKKFKDKILIVFACCFIGIGTILSNTLETKAYVSDDFTNSCSTYIYDNRTWYYNPALTNDSDYYLLVNYTISNTSSYNPIYLLSININNNSSSQFTIFDYYNSSFQYNTFIFKIPNTRLYSYFAWGFTSPYGYTFNVVNIDIVPQDEIYLESYVSNLQNSYDTLQAEYLSYQNTHAYTNEQYNALMTQNATLTQQVQSLQSQYDTYVSLHSYTNTQYETLLNNYNNLQNMYNNLQQQYLDLQQRYNELNLLLSPFIDNVWTRSATLNGQTIDISSTSYHNNIVSFNGTYLEIYPYDMDIYSSYIQGKNDFQLIATSSSTITIGNYTAIAPLSHSLDDGFRIEFYLDNNIVFSSNWFDNDMTASDGSSSTDTYSSVIPVTFNRFILYLEASTGSGGFTSYSYFKATTGSFNDGYNYAVEQLQPRINDLENGLEQAINQQQVKYSEGYNAGFDARIIHNLYME